MRRFRRSSAATRLEGRAYRASQLRRRRLSCTIFCCRKSARSAAFRWALMPGSGAAGPSLREANRTFLSTTIEPLGLLISGETERVLEAPVKLRHDRLAAADVVSRSRALKGLVEAGIQLEEAKGLVGW